MNASPLLSVVCITYNHEKYISKMIEGVLMQKVNFQYEFIIAEDCSTDATRKICIEYANYYSDKIRLITSETNVGAVENERRAMQAAKGKYIAYCEGDDYWTNPNKLQMQVDFLESNPIYTVCFHRCLHFNVHTSNYSEDLCSSFFHNNKVGVEITLSDFFNKWITQPLTMVYRRNAFDLSLIDCYENYRDMHLIYHLLKKGKGFLFSFVAGVRIIHEGGMFSTASIHKQCAVGVNVARELFLINKDTYTKTYLINMLNWYLSNLDSKKTNKIAYSLELFKLTHSFKSLIKNLLR